MNSTKSKCDIVVICCTYLKIPGIKWGSKVPFCMTSFDLTLSQISHFTANSKRHVTFFTKPGQLSFKLPRWWRSLKPSPLLRADRGRCIMARGSAGRAFNTGPLAMARKASLQLLFKRVRHKNFSDVAASRQKKQWGNQGQYFDNYDKQWFAFQPSTQTK